MVPLPLHPASPANTYPDAANLWATPDAPAGSSGYKRLKYIPFNPVDKFTMAVVQEPGANGRTVRIMKGAPQVCFLVTVCTHVAASCICGILYWCAGRCVHERQWFALDKQPHTRHTTQQQAVLKRAHNASEIHDEVEGRITALAARGYRALGFAMADGPGAPDAPGTKWEFLGLLPLFDPPRCRRTGPLCSHIQH